MFQLCQNFKKKIKEWSTYMDTKALNICFHIPHNYKSVWFFINYGMNILNILNSMSVIHCTEGLIN